MWYNERMVLLVAVCYFAALLFELLRFTHKERTWRLHWGALGIALIGFALHTLFLYQQHIIADPPLGGAAMFFLVSAWGLVLIYLLWLRRYPNIPFGIIVLPLAMLLFGGGYFSASTFETTGLTLRSVAKMLHLASAAGFVIALSVFVICRVLYFFEVRLLRKKRSLAPPIKLPSLEWSLTVSRISLVIALGCLCLCALGGIVIT